MSDKDLTIKHHKLGDITLGKIPNNEKCRMIVQLLQEKQQMNNQINIANMMFEHMPKDAMDKAKEKVKEKLETMQTVQAAEQAIKKPKKS